ncbi:general nucleoside transport system permease protein [Hyphomicrobium sp. 1Nfss2.1]|uniref:ABC transporter permease n=1 Tax=Hyphomicrobium sp. 1Nfss2.1 TaxID=3413936 RepID=UPI003C7E3104
MTEMQLNIGMARPQQPPAPPSMGRRIPGLLLEVRQHAPIWFQTLVLLCGMATGLGLSFLILLAAGVPADGLVVEFKSIFSNTTNVASLLTQLAPLLIVGLSAAVAFRVQFWNIGIEGQMIFGSIAATFVAINDIGPEPLRLPLMMAAAAIGGMAWIIVPALLRIRFGVNEIISTLLLNYVAVNFLLHLLYGGWRDPKSSFPNSEQYTAAERLPQLGWESLTYALPLALVLTLFCWWLFSLSRFGFYTRIVQSNPKMALAMGIPVIAVTLGAALLSGALAGVAGFTISSGVEYRLTQGFFLGYGFSGILIAFLARNNMIGAILVSLLVATFFVASQSLQVFYQVPGAIVQLIQAVIVISVAGFEFFNRFRLRLAR